MDYEYFKIAATPEGITAIDEVNGDKVGLNRSSFKLYLNTCIIEYKEFFTICLGVSDFDLISNSEEKPRKVSDNCFEYTCKIVTYDTDDYIPKELIVSGKEVIFYVIDQYKNKSNKMNI